MLCDLVSSKVNKLAILQIFLWSVLTNDLSCAKFHALQGKCLCYGDIHGIDCDNVPILCKNIRLGMGNGVVKENFELYCKKISFSIFWVSKREIFVKHLPRICFKIVPHHFCKIVDHILSIIHQLVASKSFLGSSRKKDKFMSI